MIRTGKKKWMVLWNDKKGNSTPFTIALVLAFLMIICTVAEFARLTMIVSGVRDGLQQAAIGAVVTNYDEVYPGLREGYSGGYRWAGNQWLEYLDEADVYYQLDGLLGTTKQGSYHIKMQGNGYEYRLSNLMVEIENPSIAPEDVQESFQVVLQVTTEIPLSFGWEKLPPLKLDIRTSAAYMSKF